MAFVFIALYQIYGNNKQGCAMLFRLCSFQLFGSHAMVVLYLDN